MLLGDLLASFRDEATATEALLSLDDLPMFTAVREQAQANGLDLGAYIADTVQLYAAQASDDEWTTLIGLLNRSSDPAATCLRRAFAYAIPGAHREH